MRPLTLSEMAEILTPETLPDFFHRLRNRPEPHSLEYEALLIKEAAETLNRSPWELFVSYQELVGEILPELTERIWQLSFPAFFHCLEAKPEPKMGTIINFPVIPKSVKKVIMRSWIDKDGNRKWTKTKVKTKHPISLKKNVIQFISKQAQQGVIAK